MIKTAGSLCPEGRSGHTAIIIKSPLVGSEYPQLFVVGGVNDKWQAFSDAWMAELGPTVTWKKVRKTSLISCIVWGDASQKI